QRLGQLGQWGRGKGGNGRTDQGNPSQGELSGSGGGPQGQAAAPSAGGDVPNTTSAFKAGEDLVHFKKHGQEIATTLGEKTYTLERYVADASVVIRNGQFVPELNGYVAIAGGQGSAKGLFVGLDRATGEITTMHLKPISFFEQKAPSLGWSAKPKSEMTDFVGPKPELGWKPPYRTPGN
ncbi:hypothetical protein, partial [Alkalilimnicola ehrlichii]